MVKVIEQATKGLALIALLAYSLGLIITNTWLYYRGISEFELFRPRYVTTGLLGLAVLVLSATGIAAIRWALGVPFERGTARILIWLLAWILALAMAAVPWALLFFVLRPPDRPNPPEGISAGRLLMIYALGMAVAGGLLLAWRKHTADESGWVPKNSNSSSPANAWIRVTDRTSGWPPGIQLLVGTWLALALVTVLLLWILQFSKHVYWRVPEQFGGTRGRLVELLIDESASQQMEAAGFNLVEGFVTCPRVELLFHGSVLPDTSAETSR